MGDIGSPPAPDRTRAHGGIIASPGAGPAPRRHPAGERLAGLGTGRQNEKEHTVKNTTAGRRDSAPRTPLGAVPPPVGGRDGRRGR
ncbi:predicted protein [Streptomyces viridosporus ATCC 14672]|uniref:Predicted protein n=1 Tax=Streptomyces viridosporus (strain ATCC 14672 / DSM 40746 / JCM 4963 / KCTC 9882 / NRRL B-12104 / FH 1290) TaxID=566461 RepID=D6A1F7_STRV1|nr:predicted protein [Streptomyces viridosporus ATCC 14672]